MSIKSFFEVLFDQGEHSCFGNLYNKAIEPIINDSREFFCINPIDPSKDHDAAVSALYDPEKPRRADMNVTKFRNFLFEMDSVSLEDQMSIIEASEIPFSTIVYSGGKSYHCVISLQEPLEVPTHTSLGISLYKKDWERIAAYLTSVGERLFPGKYQSIIDPTSKNPSRLSRCPGFERSPGKIQSIVKLGVRISEEVYFSLLSKCPEIEDKEYLSQSYLIDFEINSVSDFWHYAPKGIKNKFKYCAEWVADSGMYEKMFRYTLWAIDSTGVSKTILLQILEDTVFKRFDSVGYPKHKHKLGVNSAYKHKLQRSR